MLSDRIRNLDQLARGDDRRTNPRFSAGCFERNIRLVAALREFAARRGVSVCRLALAWVQHRGPDVVPIPGAGRRQHVVENVAAIDINLSSEELAHIEQLCPSGGVAGHRMDPRRARMLAGGHD